MSEFKLGETIGIAKLRNTYDRYVFNVIGGMLDNVPVPRGKQRKYQANVDLPSVEEYRRLKSSQYSTTVESLIDDAQGVVEELRDEMTEWHDNMPENLQDGDVGSRVQEAADALESVEVSTAGFDEHYLNLTTVFYPMLDCDSRRDRACDAGNQLQTAIDAIQEDIDDESVETDDEPDLTELENAVSELENVEFPSMFG